MKKFVLPIILLALAGEASALASEGETIRLRADKLNCNLLLRFPHLAKANPAGLRTLTVPLDDLGAVNNRSLLVSYPDYKAVLDPLIENWPALLLGSWFSTRLGDQLTVETEKSYEGNNREYGLVLLAIVMDKRNTAPAFDGVVTFSVTTPLPWALAVSHRSFLQSLERVLGEFPRGTRMHHKQEPIPNVRDQIIAVKNGFTLSITFNERNKAQFFRQAEKLYQLSTGYLDGLF